MRLLQIAIFGTILLVTSKGCISQPLPSLCKTSEFAYINAKMAELRYPRYTTEQERNSKPVWILRDIGKFLSICTDKKMAPFSSVVYRFGSVEKIELERFATSASPFFLFERATSPHTGQNILFFHGGPYTYCVMEATAQGNGISLVVIKDGREVASYFSGNNRNSDFEVGSVELNIGNNKSPTLKSFNPKNNFETPCDGVRLMRP